MKYPNFYSRHIQISQRELESVKPEQLSLPPPPNLPEHAATEIGDEIEIAIGTAIAIGTEASREISLIRTVQGFSQHRVNVNP